jgi:hypothetical protein
VLSGRGLCYLLTTRPEEFYRLWCVVVCDLCDLETSWMRSPWSNGGCRAEDKQTTNQNCGLGVSEVIPVLSHLHLINTVEKLKKLPSTIERFLLCSIVV